MLKRIHVDQHVIRRNAKLGEHNPPISIKTSKGNTKARSVQILGPSRLVYSPDKPLSCGAKLWVETRADIIAE